MSAGSFSVGLLLPHKRTRVRIFSDMVTVSTETENHSGGGKRGEITCFSKESRLRLFRLFHSLRFERFSFVTLTYGNTFPACGRDAKVDLKAYRRAFERRYGKVRAVWRLEFQSRGAPHFHILYLDCPFIPVQDWNNLWDECRHAPIDERKGNSLDLKISNKPGASDLVSKYLGKYISKVDTRGTNELPPNTGRIWGRWNIPDAKPVEYDLSSFEAEKLATLLITPDDQEGYHPPSREAYTIFGQSMGTDTWANEVQFRVEMLLLFTRRVEKKVNVSFDT